MLQFIANTSFQFYDRIRQSRQEDLDHEAIRRLLYVEARQNLALLGTLKLDDSVPQQDLALRKAALLLSSQGLEGVVAAGGTAAKAFEKLQSVTVSDEGEEDPEVNSPITDTMSRLLVRLVNVRQLAAIYEELDAQDGASPAGLRNIRFRTRLRNIRRSFVEIVETLASQAK